MMIFGRSGLRPRRFVYHPRYYDPSKEMDRRDRMDFSRLRSARENLPGKRSPAWFFLLVLVVLVIVWKLGTLGSDLSRTTEIVLDTSDVPVTIKVTVPGEETPETGESAVPDSTSIRRNVPENKRVSEK